MRRSTVRITGNFGVGAVFFGLVGAGFLLPAASLRAAPAAALQSEAAAPETATDVLVYHDGDRVRGHLVERRGSQIVFQSERFGLLRVASADAQVVLNQTPAAASELVAKGAAPKSAARSEVAAQRAEAASSAETAANGGAANGWASLLSIRALTVALRDAFGPWHGRFAFSSEIDHDTSERNTDLLEAHFVRKWTRDEVDLTSRYDFSETNHVTTTDVLKSEGFWRHKLPHRLFSVYHPTVEWNRAFALNNIPSDYVLLQQEIGAGLNLFASERRTLNVGLAENLFDVWQTAPSASHTSRTVESAFVEADWKLPWRMTLTERGVVYYAVATGRSGYENRVQLDKKLTETFSVGIRQEVRRNNPDVRVQDYSLLRLLVGLDF